MYIVSCKIYMYQLIYELQAWYLWRYTIPPSSQYTAAHLDLRFASSDMREVRTRVWCHNQHISSHPALNDNKYSVCVSPDLGNASHISQSRLVYWSTPSSYSHSSLWKIKGSLILRYTVTMVKSEGRLQRHEHNHLAAYQPSSHSKGTGSNLTRIISWIHVGYFQPYIKSHAVNTIQWPNNVKYDNYNSNPYISMGCFTRSLHTCIRLPIEHILHP